MSRVLRVAGKSLLVIVSLLVATVCGVLLYADHLINREVEAPYPPIAADMSPAGLQRGKAIFRTMCEGCHRAPNSDRAEGAAMSDLPKFLGSFHTANLTSHPTAGIGALRDEQIARMVRYGVNRHNRSTIMPNSGMSDADLAAIIGFMRSNDPVFRPSARIAPK